MRWFLDQGLSGGSVIIRGSQREISVAIDANLAAVNKGIKSLRELGWLEPYEAHAGLRATAYKLVLPDAGNVVTGVPLFMGGKDTPVPVLPAKVPRLFGSQGLGRGPAETYAHLSELRRRTAAGHLVRTNRDVPRSCKEAARGLPWAAAAHGGVGLSTAELAEYTPFSVETVRRHCKRLEQAGLTFRVGGRWYRYHAQVEVMADYLGIPNTANMKKDRYDLAKRGWMDFLSTDRGRATYGVSLHRVIDGEFVVYGEFDRDGVFKERWRAAIPQPGVAAERAAGA